MKTLYILLIFTIGFLYGRNYDNHQVDFSVYINDNQVNLDLTTVFLLQGKKIHLKVDKNSGEYKIIYNSGKLDAVSDFEWRYQPDSSEKSNFFIVQKNMETMKVQFIIMKPINEVKNGMINGYKIGKYPQKLLRGNKKYSKPVGLIEVTPKNKNLLLTPHFRLGQFLCKQAGSYPKYVVIREPLLHKLEYILTEFNKKGYAANTFFIMSGYRTPFYNAAIKNVKYSRHVYGDAADIYIDDNDDRMLDDLNKDGKFNYADVLILYNIIDNLVSRKEYKPFIGGLGKYKKNSSHPGFVHIDVRGYRARW